MSWDPSQRAVSLFKWLSLLVANGKSEKEDYPVLVKGREAVALSPSGGGNSLGQSWERKAWKSLFLVVFPLRP